MIDGGRRGGGKKDESKNRGKNTEVQPDAGESYNEAQTESESREQNQRNVGSDVIIPSRRKESRKFIDTKRTRAEYTSKACPRLHSSDSLIELQYSTCIELRKRERFTGRPIKKDSDMRHMSKARPGLYERKKLRRPQIGARNAIKAKTRNWERRA